MITRHPNSRSLVIHTTGDLDALRVEHYRQQLRTLIDDEGYRYLIFDLEKTRYINSSALGLLVELHKTIQRLSGSMKLINCDSPVLDIIRQTRLDSVLLGDGPQTPGAHEEKCFDPLHDMMREELLLLAHINEFSGMAFRIDRREDLHKLILESVVDALKARRGVLYELDEATQVLHLAHWVDGQGEGPAPSARAVHLRSDRLESRILEGRDVLWHQLNGKEGPGDRLFHQLGFKTMLAAPIWGRRRRIGLLAVEAGEETDRIVQAAKPLIQTFTQISGHAFDALLTRQELDEAKSQFLILSAEAEQARQSCRRAGPLAALGASVAALGHQLNNAMVPLSGYCQLLGQDPKLNEAQKQKVATIRQAGEQTKEIVEKLLRVGRSKAPKSNPAIDPTTLIGTAVDLLGEPIERNNIDVTLKLDENGGAVQADPGLMLQVMLAIMHRACNSFEGPDRKNWVHVVGSAVEGKLRLIVADNGEPFDEHDTQERNDPLVPYEAMTHGRLFNYTIPRGLIRRLKGRIELDPSPDGGKQVIIDLPLAPEPAADRAEAGEPPAPAVGGPDLSTPHPAQSK